MTMKKEKKRRSVYILRDKGDMTEILAVITSIKQVQAFVNEQQETPLAYTTFCNHVKQGQSGNFRIDKVEVNAHSDISPVLNPRYS